MDFEGHQFKVIRFPFHFLESWNPVSKTLNKIRCRLFGFPADASPAPALAQLSSGHCGMVAHLCSLLPSCATIFLKDEKYCLTTWILFFVGLVQAVRKEMLQSKSPVAGESGTLEKKWLHCQRSEPITSAQGHHSAFKKLQQKLSGPSPKIVNFE